MIYGWKVFRDVSLDDVNPRPVPPRTPQERLKAVHGGVSTLTAPTGMRVVNKLALKKRLNNAHKRMVDNAIAEGRRLNLSPLRVVNPELPPFTRRPCLPDQVVLDIDQIFFKSAGEP